MAPPRERGSAPDARLRRARVPGSPARAGIGPRMTSSRTSTPWLPRASGDRPVSRCGRSGRRAAPPRERGSALARVVDRHGEAGSPARAGIGPAQIRPARALSWLPRASGDRPGVARVSDSVIVAPPRERGSAHRGPEEPERGAGSPARAGIGPRPCSRAICSPWLPRASGDRPGERASEGRVEVAPPRERGSARHPVRHRVGPQGSPARAGIGPTSRPSSPSGCRLPRASGDRPQAATAHVVLVEAPPRERGSALF